MSHSTTTPTDSIESHTVSTAWPVARRGYSFVLAFNGCPRSIWPMARYGYSFRLAFDGCPRFTFSSVEPYRALVQQWCDADVQGKAIHAALCREYGYRGSYSSVARMLASMRAARPPEVTVRLTFQPGEAAQVDFGAGPMLVHPDGKPRRSCAFVMTLCHSRHQYVAIADCDVHGKTQDLTPSSPDPEFPQIDVCPPWDRRLERVWVWGPPGPDLIQARRLPVRHHDAVYVSEHRSSPSSRTPG